MSDAAESLEMFVEFESATGSLAFTLNRVVSGAGETRFDSHEAAAAHPLARKLMEIDGVRLVVLAAAAVRLACDPEEDLEEVAARAELVLRHYFSNDN
ncbi:MAG: NifU N-terminal domain-containing protein [Candidatus Wallbacteria bacterium]|nr:NifU N-terminal domain-containing protein [Candidatus Wallbacteria bacterium]